jgi:hypothetical protein
MRVVRGSGKKEQQQQQQHLLSASESTIWRSFNKAVESTTMTTLCGKTDALVREDYISIQKSKASCSFERARIQKRMYNAFVHV